MILDHANERSLHHDPTPRGGGIGIAVPVSLGLFFLSGAPGPWAVAGIWMAGAGAIVASAGLVDDILTLPAVPRLVVQLFAAWLLTQGIGEWRLLTWPGLFTVDLGQAAPVVTVLLLVGLTNAYNFMDGVDGIAGTQGILAGAGWVGIGYAMQEPALASIGAILATTSLGFLLFNWPPASIFMGDVGSCFLGFVLAALTIHVATRSPVAATAGLLCVWPFIFDTAFTLVNRMRRRENVLRAHRSHLYQRLVLSGSSHQSVTVLYGALAAAGAAVGNAMVRESAPAAIAGAVLIAMLACGLWWVVVLQERRA